MNNYRDQINFRDLWNFNAIAFKGNKWYIVDIRLTQWNENVFSVEDEWTWVSIISKLQWKYSVACFNWCILGE